MRIFIHNVDTFLGKILVNELRKADGGNHRTFGTVSIGGNQDDVPKVVKRICSREDPKKTTKMISTLQSCKVVVLDLFSCSREDLDFAMKAFRNMEELETDVTFILISSVMAWADTKAVAREPGDSQTLRDSDYLHREPPIGSKYEQWKEMEDLVMNTFNREGSKVKGLIVAGGILYGAGEGVFMPLFKNAWCGNMEHAILGKGTNSVPTIHVRDLARMVRAVMGNPDGNPDVNPAETPYFIAVDQPSKEGAETSTPLTQAEIVQGIVDEMCDPYKVPCVAEPSPPVIDPDVELDAGQVVEMEQQEDLRLTMLLNLHIQPSKQLLDPEFNTMAEPHPSGWHCKEGIVKHVRKIAQEFCDERKLRAMRVLIAGPPASGKSTLAANVSEHFRIPHHNLLADNCKEMTETLSERVCRYRGYVLDAGLAGFDRVNKVFRYEIETPTEAADEAGDGDGDGDGDGEKKEPEVKQPEFALHEDIVPSFVIVTQAPPKVLEGYWIKARGSKTLDQFRQQMEQYEQANSTDTTMHLTAFFLEVAKVGILNLPIVGRDEDELFESARIYMEQEGRPFNYLPTEEEVAKDVRELREKKLLEAAEKMTRERLKSKDTGDESEAGESRHAERMRLVAEHEVAQQELRKMPLRDYLMEYMIPSLTEGLIEVCKVLPENPSDYLANYLEQHAPAEADDE